MAPSQHDLRDEHPHPHQDESSVVVPSVVEETWPAPKKVLVATTKVSTFQLGRHCLKIKKLQTPQGLSYPNDMRSNFNGTGHCVWLASLAFLHLLEEGGDGEASLLADPYFDSLRVIELGCGTGASGIATLLFADPLHVTLTDHDEAALALAKENCQLNHLDASRYDVQMLDWCHSHNNNNNLGTFQTVLATDVVYQLDRIVPLLETAFLLLEEGGHFCLSHVPRFCLPREEKYDPTTTSSTTSSNTTQNNHQESSSTTTTTTTTTTSPIEDLEDYIVTHALAQGFQLQETIRPDQVLMELPLDGDDDDDDEERKREDTNMDTVVDDGDESSRPLTLKKLRQAHAVLFLFVKN
jgi:SAM-dependent methyltransferase